MTKEVERKIFKKRVSTLKLDNKIFKKKEKKNKLDGEEVKIEKYLKKNVSDCITKHH